MTHPEVLSIVLATAAFLVAVLTLYLGTLKRAEISLVFLSDRGVWVRQQQHRDAGPPEWGELCASFAAINSGAGAGLLTDLVVERTKGPLFDVEGCVPVPNFRDGELRALPVLGGQAEALTIVVTVRFHDPAVDAWTSGSFTSFDVVLSYSYLRGRKVRPRKTRRLKVPFPVKDIAWTQ